jgi:hypothetical protein
MNYIDLYIVICAEFKYCFHVKSDTPFLICLCYLFIYLFLLIGA